jgi:hypothetical protein
MECRVVPLGDASLKINWFKNGEALQAIHKKNILKYFIRFAPGLGRM